MTDEEMIRVMEICKDKETPCDDCPLVECGDCEEISRQYFYERFKELKAENVALQNRFNKTIEILTKFDDYNKTDKEKENDGRKYDMLTLLLLIFFLSDTSPNDKDKNEK